jgi:hypothetical protein
MLVVSGMILELHFTILLQGLGCWEAPRTFCNFGSVSYLTHGIFSL